jgi:5-methylcytosine-specific restriction endonuclease McrA
MKNKFNFTVQGKKGFRRVVVVRDVGSKNKDHIIPKSFLRELSRNNIKVIDSTENLKKGNKLTREALEKIFKTIIKYI